jgi:hypothetical protein
MAQGITVLAGLSSARAFVCAGAILGATGEMVTMPSMWEVAGEALEGSLLAPLVIGGVIVSAIASPEIRQRMRRLGVRGMAAALAAGDAARRELRITSNGSGDLAVQIGHRLKEAVAEVREDWEDFVAEARAERERRQAGAASRARVSNGAITGMDEPPSGGTAKAAPRRARSTPRRPRR